MTRRVPRRVGLQLKLSLLLLLLTLVPLIATGLLVGNIGEVAQNFARNHVAQLRPHLETAQGAYRELIVAKKQQYQETVRRLASAEGVRAVAVDSEAPTARLQEVLEDHDELLALEIVAKDGSVLQAEARPTPSEGQIRELQVRQAIGVAGAELVATFAADLKPVEDLQALAKALAVSQQVDKVQSSLPASYRIAFLLLIGAVVLAVTGIAFLAARQITRRIGTLVSGTRQVAKGDLEARVELGGNDEIAELAAAFNGMVGDLQDERQKILYLQRIGAWQDVARKLAHEIKNPLTPIQLVVQQVVSSYQGEDERYQKLLATCDEIVHEEVDGLRRLVDAFRDLGRLPKVEATELSMNTVADDLEGDPALSEHLVITRPEAEVLVSADRLLLRRTLVNLIENGVHAGLDSSTAGVVRVHWKVVDAMVDIVIDDEGAGVPPSKREQIFDPYVTSKETGTGLGLAIAKKVALDHHGDLLLSEAPAPTGGARFVLRIPLAET